MLVPIVSQSYNSYVRRTWRHIFLFCSCDFGLVLQHRFPTTRDSSKIMQIILFYVHQIMCRRTFLCMPSMFPTYVHCPLKLLNNFLSAQDFFGSGCVGRVRASITRTPSIQNIALDSTGRFSCWKICTVIRRHGSVGSVTNTYIWTQAWIFIQNIHRLHSIHINLPR